MNKNSFAFGKSPMIAGVIKEKDPYSVICRMREAEFAGARGFDLHIPILEKEYQNVETIRKIVESTDRPILALNYDNEHYTEEERMESLLMAARAGVSAVDIQGYTFDIDSKKGFIDAEHIPSGMEFLLDRKPNEVALKPEIIDKQRDFIDKVHNLGVEVLASIHFGTVLSKEELATVARFAHSKGADIVKMVGTCTDKYQVPEAIEATMYLKDNLDFPFSYHLNGLLGIPTRKLCPLFGSHIVFCNVDYSGGRADPEQLHVRSIVDTYRSLGIL